MRLGPRRRAPAGSREAVVELDALAKPRERVARRRSLDVGLVDLRHAVARVREPMREVAVVREEERARRVGVETTDRDDARLVAGRDRRRSAVPADRAPS